MKKLLPWLTAFLLLPGNVILLCYITEVSFLTGRRFSHPGNDGYSLQLMNPAFAVLGNNRTPQTDYLVLTGENSVTLRTDAGNISFIGATSTGNRYFSWHHADRQGQTILEWNGNMAADWNQDLIFDFLSKPDGSRHLQLNGNWLPCKTFDAENRRAELADGRIFQWRQAGWQPAVH